MVKFLSSLYERFGLNAYVQGDYEKALENFRRLEKAEPDSIRVLRTMGVIYLAMGDAKKAKAYISREEGLYGPSYQRHSALADLAYADGDRREAAKRYKLALAEPEAGSEGSARAMRPFLEARLGISADPQAFEKSRESLERFAAGEKARDSGDIPGALALFEEAVALDPTNWPALNNAGSIVLNSLGDAGKAREYFARALTMSRSPQIARNLELAENAIFKASAGAGSRGQAKAKREGKKV